MKILSIIHATQPGGVQRVGAMETAILNNSGYRAFLVSILKTYEWDLFKKLNINPIYLFNSEFFGRLISGIYIKTINIGTDIIIAHNNPCAQLAFKLKETNKNTSIIFYLHDSLVYPIAGSLFGEMVKRFPRMFKKLEQRHIRMSDIVLVNSNVTLTQLKKNHGKLIEDSEIHILYPTVNNSLPKSELVENKKEYILIVGRFDHEAFYNICKIIKTTDYPFVVAGYGHPRNPMVKEVLSLIKTLKNKGKNIRVVFAPSDDQLVELYKNASLFVYPGHENFNMSAIEAMSTGCPILVANSSGVCEILPQNLRDELCLDKNNLEDWINKIQEIIESDRSYELGKKCWKVTLKYNLNTHMAKLIKILKEVQSNG